MMFHTLFCFYLFFFIFIVFFFFFWFTMNQAENLYRNKHIHGFKARYFSTNFIILTRCHWYFFIISFSYSYLYIFTFLWSSNCYQNKCIHRYQSTCFFHSLTYEKKNISAEMVHVKNWNAVFCKSSFVSWLTEQGNSRHILETSILRKKSTTVMYGFSYLLA